MRTMIKLIAALLIAAMMMTGAALAAGTIRTDGSVNLRKGPGLDYASKGTIEPGKVLNYDDTKKDERGVIWYHVTDGKGGWVSSKYTTQVSGESDIVEATGNVNLRKGPGLDYADIGTMKTGEKATYLGETKKDERGVAWYKVSFDGKTGWVSSRYSALKSGDSSVVKATGSVNLRKGPGLDYADIGTMHKGDKAAYLGETKKDERGVAWYKVSFDGKTGWVSSKYGKLYE